MNLTLKRTAEMLKKDLAAARAAWIAESPNVEERQRRVHSSFLKYQNDQGQFADFHALRKRFITNLSRAGVSPMTAQLLARHSDINLTMNTYTMLGVLARPGNGGPRPGSLHDLPQTAENPPRSAFQ